MANKKIKKVSTKIKTAAKTLKQETKKNVISAITAAFAFLIALAWRDVIKEYVNKIIEKLALQGTNPLVQLYATLLTTIICVLGIIIVSKWSNKV